MMQPSFRLFLVFLPVLQTQAIQLLNFTKNRCDNRLRAGWLVASQPTTPDGGRTLSDTSQTILDDLGPVVVVVEMRAQGCFQPACYQPESHALYRSPTLTLCRRNAHQQQKQCRDGEMEINSDVCTYVKVLLRTQTRAGSLREILTRVLGWV